VRIARSIKVASVLCVGALTLAACGGSNNESSESPAADGGGTSGAVRVDGSSTVAPLTSAAAELFAETNPDINVTVGTSGTGGGFEKFCRGETDMNDASREIKDEEAASCAKNGVTYGTLEVALDALTVVVNQQNTWATCLTVDQLKKNNMKVLPPSAELKKDLVAIGDKMTREWLEKAGPEGQAVLDAYRKAKK